MVKLGSYLCDRAYRNKTAEEREIIFGTDPGATVPIEAFTPENTMEMGKTMMSRFWGLDRGSIADDNKNLETLMSLADESIQDLEAYEEENGAISEGDKVRLTVTGMCTAALTSAQVSFYGY